MPSTLSIHRVDIGELRGDQELGEEGPRAGGVRGRRQLHLEGREVVRRGQEEAGRGDRIGQESASRRMISPGN